MFSSRDCSGFLPEASSIRPEWSFTQRNGFRTTTSSGISLSWPEQPVIFVLSSGMLDKKESMSHPVDKLIEEWLAENEFEELPGTGKPLNLDEYFSWPEDQRIGLSILKNSGCVPLEVERLREIKRLSDEVEKCPDETVRVRLNRRLQEEQVELNLVIESRRRRKR
jgi:hypothetical protein